MRDDRVPFDEAVSSFVDWLRREGHSDSLLWLTADRVTGFRREFWIYRPDTMTSIEPSRRFYEAARSTASSIRLDMFCAWQEHTVVYVEDWGRDSRFLNFGIPGPGRVVHGVTSPVVWAYYRAYCRIRGRSPLLADMRMTPSHT